MSDPWKSPKYAPNSDAEEAVQDDSDSTDYEGSPPPAPKEVVDPWNDPEDDDEDDDDSPRREPSPDYLGADRSSDSKKRSASAAWDALNDDDDDETDDDIPPGVSVGGRETKDSNGVVSHPSTIVSKEEASDPNRNNHHHDSEEPERKRQRLSEADGSGDQTRNEIIKTEQETHHRPATHPSTLEQAMHPMHAPPQSRPAAPLGNPGSRGQHARHPAHHPMPGLMMPSFFGITPRDEFVRIIGEWLLRVCHGCQGKIEIEIKFGTLLDRQTKKRISLPSLTEMILPDNFECVFTSEMTERQHARLNQFLNKEVEFCSGKAGPHPILQPHHYYPITYKHTHTTDSFFPASQMSASGAKRRVTTNDKTGQVVECMEKIKLANLNVYSPNEEFDWRVSVNLELPAQVQPHETSAYARRKDRVSYKHSLFQIDLTQVSNPANGSPPVHELEIEVVNAVDLLTQGWKESQNMENNFEQQLLSLLNTARLLNRNAGPKFSHPPGRPQ